MMATAKAAPTNATRFKPSESRFNRSDTARISQRPTAVFQASNAPSGMSVDS